MAQKAWSYLPVICKFADSMHAPICQKVLPVLDFVFNRIGIGKRQSADGLKIVKSLNKFIVGICNSISMMVELGTENPPFTAPSGS